MSNTPPIDHFSQFGLPNEVLSAIQEIGYETPTPIQARTIPPLLKGCDLLGHAPTGTGKTAAFALPILARLSRSSKQVEVLVLTPTRELALQVAEAFSRYASHLKNLHILPIYGGQDYKAQIRQLQRGVNIVVGTPGRVMDHMRRGTLQLNALKTLVLDEADEMLRMGFIDDVEWILQQTPDHHQLALFSATMPREIRRIADEHLNDPVSITIEGRLTTADTIRQRFWLVSGLHKLDALTRILEAETFDAMIVFVRTRTATVELAEKLQARGFRADAINGDMPQKHREHRVEKLKKGQLDILVATDVVARGLDVERISHVINYDIPYDTEAYVHRIGRTGRAGRSGDAILFVTQRERRLLGAIERATRQKIEPLVLPTIEMVNNKRIAVFKQTIADTLATGELRYLEQLSEEFSQERNIPPARVAAALAKMYLGEQPLLLTDRRERARNAEKSRKDSRQRQHESLDRQDSDNQQRQNTRLLSSNSTNQANQQIKQAGGQYKPENTDSTQTQSTATKPRGPSEPARARSRTQPSLQEVESIETELFRVEVGAEDGVKPQNLVGAIANETGIDAAFIGRITIEASYSLIELPTGMPKFLLKDLKKVWVCNKQLAMSRLTNSSDSNHSTNTKRKTSRPTKTSEKPRDKRKKSKTQKAVAQNKPRDSKKKNRHRTSGVNKHAG